MILFVHDGRGAPNFSIVRYAPQEELLARAAIEEEGFGRRGAKALQVAPEGRTAILVMCAFGFGFGAHVAWEATAVCKGLRSGRAACGNDVPTASRRRSDDGRGEGGDTTRGLDVHREAR